MKNTILLLVTLFTVTNVGAQVGLSGTIRGNDNPAWIVPVGGDIDGEKVLVDRGFAFGIDYWFRLKNVRIEFLPELNFSTFGAEPETDLALESTFYSLFLNTNFYVLDFLGDCDCPTFSKQGTFLDKGFFLQVSPGISRYELKATNDTETIASNNWMPSLGVGLGIDIGASDLLTITPIAGLRYYFGSDLAELEKEIQTANGPYSVALDQNNILQYFAGLRLGLRFRE